MNRMFAASLSSAGTLLVFGLLGQYVPRWIGLEAPWFWVLRGLLWTIGLVATILLFLYQRARARAQPKTARDDEVDGAFEAVRKRLPAGVKVGRAPVLLVIGPGGAAKTTVVQRSGLDPELLAGEVERNQAVVPTTINVWYSDGTIVTEVGGRLIEDEKRWARLLERLEPSRLAAMLPGGRQAPRLAIVCLSCEDLAKPGAAPAAAARGQALRQRLLEAANRFGIRLPVYVVFTKADRLPYFTDYVRSFTAQESGEVFGTTLPVAPPMDAGRFKEAENARLDTAFARMLHTLSLRRLDVLPRETAEEVRAGAYEFPRELGKASAAAKQFLVELCRPGQIGVSPFLRGFYFTGVRPIVVSDAPQAVAPRPVSGGAVDATAVFDARAIQAAARQEAAQPGTRRVPDWTFLPGIFKRVILKDHVAMGLTSGGTRVNLLRRLVFAVLTAAFLFLTGALVVSWVRNRGLIDDARVAATAVQGIDQSGAGMATLEDLGRLDTLRTLGVRLRGWHTDGPPTSYRWGLYQGDALLTELRGLYFQRFGRVLWEGTRRNLAGFLLALPDTPTAASQYQSAFEGLKAYIVTTDHPEYSTSDFLTPVLLEHWQTAREVEPERADAASRQFDFFATELPFGNPYEDPVDAALVDRTRAFLARFGNVDRLYTALVSQASSSAAPIRFADLAPGSEAVLRADFVVPGAFTRDGWTFVQQNVANVDRFFATDTWVLGEQTVSPADRQRMADSLRVRYVDEYVRTWTEFLARARVVPYGGNAAVAARNLGRLSSNQSPLLQLFSIASTNTAVDTAVVGRAFQPVQLVVPPSSTDRLVGPGNQPYMAGLAELASQMEAVAQANGPERTSAIGQAEGTARRVEGTVTAMSLEFATQGAAAAIGSSVRSLLMQPIDYLDPLIAAIPAGAVNEQGASFCSTVQPVLAKYPFNPSSGTYATIDDLNRVFRPQGSALAALTSRLGDVVERLGSTYSARPGAEFAPTTEFLTMLNSVQRISDALYTENPQEPGFSYLLQPQRTDAFPEVTFAINGTNHTVTATEFGMKPFRWRLTEEREGRITARRADGGSVTLVDFTGPWASFRMLAQARWQPSANGSNRLTWNVNTGTVSADIFPAGGPVPDPSLFQGLSCVPRVVR